MEIVYARTNYRIHDFLPEHLAFNQNVRQASQALLASKQSIEKRRKVTEIRGEICASLRTSNVSKHEAPHNSFSHRWSRGVTTRCSSKANVIRERGEEVRSQIHSSFYEQSCQPDGFECVCLLAKKQTVRFYLRIKSFMALETVLQNVDFDPDRQTCPTCTRARHEAH